MVKHNNVLPNGHFHKDWQRRVRTWFQQPAQKKIRRERRVAKAKQMAPRPLNSLRPAVRCPTIKYNRKVRAGRGFTLAELRAAGVNPLEAPGIGISVDHRRHNRSQEGFNSNVQRLKNYKAKLIVFPRRNNKNLKNGDASLQEQKLAQQVVSRQVLPIVATVVPSKARVITKADRELKAAHSLRKARTDCKLAGVREKRAKEKAEAAKLGAGKSKGDDE